MPLRVKRCCPEVFNSAVHLCLAVLQAVEEQAFLCSAGWVSAGWRGTRGLSQADARGGGAAELGRCTWWGLSEADARGGRGCC